MKEKIKIMLSLVIFLFLFPYIVTVFFQGTPVAGESVYETATETAVMAQGSMPKEREQLIAYNRTIDEIREIIGADSLGYLDVERLEELSEGLSICKGCFNGIYPLEPPKEDIRGSYEK